MMRIRQIGVGRDRSSPSTTASCASEGGVGGEGTGEVSTCVGRIQSGTVLGWRRCNTRQHKTTAKEQEDEGSG